MSNVKRKGIQSGTIPKYQCFAGLGLGIIGVQSLAYRDRFCIKTNKQKKTENKQQHISSHKIRKGVLKEWKNIQWDEEDYKQHHKHAER